MDGYGILGRAAAIRRKEKPPTEEKSLFIEE